MNYTDHERDIFDTETFTQMNRLYLSKEIDKSHKAGEITSTERQKLWELIADEMEREFDGFDYDDETPRPLC